MHPRLTELLAHLDGEHRYLHDAIARGAPADRLLRPGPDRWSVAEVIEHVAIVEGRVGTLIATQVDQARGRGIGPDPDLSPILPTLGLEQVARREEKISASAPVIPRDVVDADAPTARLDAAYQALITAVRASDGVNLAEITVSHPVFGPSSLYRWIGISGAHKRRHAAQIEETYRDVGGAEH
ncbi:MAG TPA: DinB family protein [Gemmatimonadales bacterium]|jgi:hypothetical protein